MNFNIQATREIKENLGRARTYLNKQEPLKGINFACEAIKAYSQNKIFGKDKIEIEYYFYEIADIIKSLKILEPYLPEEFEYKKGQEKKFYKELVEIIRRVAEELNKEPSEKEEEYSSEIKKRKLLEKMKSMLISGNKQHASSQVKKLLEEYGETAEIYSHIAENYYQAGLYKDALTYIKKALSKDPQDITSYRLVINALRKLKEFEKAESFFKQALNKFGEHANTYLNLARLYWEWNKPELAQKTAQKAASLDPDNQEIKQVVSDITTWAKSQSEAEQ